MCGIFGFVSSGSNGPSVCQLAQLANETERRGDHAFGFAWVDSNGRMRAYKQSGPISQNLYLLGRLADARMVIGHCRWATHGSIDDNTNNHPHPVDGGWLVHNGVIRHHASLVDRFDLTPTSQCDSEVLGLLIEHFSGTMIERVSKTIRLTATAPLALLALWRNPQRLILARAGNPLFLSNVASGAWFASQTDGLPGRPLPIPDCQGIAFGFRSGKQTARAFHLAVPQQRASITCGRYGA